MTNPNDFILSSDFTTFKYDTNGNTVSVTIPSGSTIPTSSPAWDTTAVGGSPQSFLRARMFCSLDNRWGSGTTLLTLLNVSIMDGSTVLFTGDQVLTCNLDKISDSSVRLRLWLEYFSGYTYRVNETVTVTFVYSTLLNPLL